jgi:hypothetical protein
MLTIGTPYLREQECEDPRLLVEARTGWRAKTFGKHFFKETNSRYTHLFGLARSMIFADSSSFVPVGIVRSRTKATEFSLVLV